MAYAIAMLTLVQSRYFHSSADAGWQFRHCIPGASGDAAKIVLTHQYQKYIDRNKLTMKMTEEILKMKIETRKSSIYAPLRAIFMVIF